MIPKILIVIAALIAAPLARADGLPFLQIAAYGGYRVGGSLEDSVSGDAHDLDDGTSLALALEFRYGKGDDRYLQLWYSRQGSSVNDGLADHDVDIEYLHIGGTVPFGDYEKAQALFRIGYRRDAILGVECRCRLTSTQFSGLAGLWDRNAGVRDTRQSASRRVVT